MRLANPDRGFAKPADAAVDAGGRSRKSDKGERLTRDMLALVGILSAAAMLRLVAINSQALWSDEGQTLILSLYPTSEMLWQPTDPTPFLYYALHHLFLSPLSGVPAVRMISVVCGVASVGLMYWLGRLVGGRRSTGLFCAALLAFWTAHVDYSMEARAYSLLSFTTLLSFLGVVIHGHSVTNRLASRHAWRGLALLVTGNVLSFYTHVIAIFPIAATSSIVVLSALLYDRRSLPSLLAVYALMAALAVPGVMRLLLQAKTGDAFNWLVQAGPVTFVSTAADFFFPMGLWDNAVTNGLGLRHAAKYVCVPIFAALLVAALFHSRRQIRTFAQFQPYTALLILTCLLSPLAIWLVGYIGRPLFLGRVLLFSVPGFILLICVMAPGWHLQIGRMYQLAALALMIFSTLLFGMMREKEDWRGANAYISQHAGPNDVIAVCAGHNFPAARHAADRPLGQAAVIPNRRGQMVLLERGLGSDPNWAASYFNVIQRNASLGAANITLRPGDSVWRIDAACAPDRQDARTLDQMLAPLGKTPSVEWRQEARYDDDVRIRRYRADRMFNLVLANGQSPRT